MKDAYVLAEPFLEDESNLGTEVHLKFGDIKYVDENVQADDMCGRQSSAVKRVINSQKGNLIPLVIFAEDKVDCTSGWSITSGCAFTSSACGTSTGTNIGIVDMGPVGRGCASGYPNNDVQGSAMTFVHEIGHMVGISFNISYNLIFTIRLEWIMTFQQVGPIQEVEEMEETVLGRVT